MGKLKPRSNLWLIFIVVFFNSISSMAAMLSDENSQALGPREVMHLKRHLEEQKQNVANLNKKLSRLDASMNPHQTKLKNWQERRLELENAMEVGLKNLEKENLLMSQQLQKYHRVILGMVMNRLEKREDPASMVAQKYLLVNFEKKSQELSLIKKNNDDLKSQIDGLKIKIDEVLKNEKEISSVLSDLTQQKTDINQDLLSKEEEIKKIEMEFKAAHLDLQMKKDEAHRRNTIVKRQMMQLTENIKSEITKPQYSSNENPFSLPIKSPEKLEHGEKGITLKFLGKNEVLAPQNGRVFYTGTLANYGNVVMLDHGNEVRTVLLGNFEIEVKKGDEVKLGQILGHTNKDLSQNISKSSGQIYFEVRKKGLPQNTYRLVK